MAKYASKVVAQAKAWIGLKESNGTHKQIIDVYNSHKPLARGYAVNWKKDPWCATFVSAVAIKLGYTDIIPTECSCNKMIELFKSLDAWVEDESVTPKTGWILFYDWEDNAAGDNKGRSDHVGIVEKVVGNTITIIEGNYSNSVKRRTLKVNGKYIRGYGVPKYDAEVAATPDPVKITVKEWQTAAVADGRKFARYGIDGIWGAECEAVAKNSLVMWRRNSYVYNNLTKIVQRVVGVEVDGKCGKNTDAAIREYQRKNGLTVDGVVGLKTWRKILGV